jgi:hypothetical protein
MHQTNDLLAFFFIHETLLLNQILLNGAQETLDCFGQDTSGSEDGGKRITKRRKSYAGAFDRS